MHGYMIAKVVCNIVGPFQHVQWGALYPVLNKLEREGLIRAEEGAESGDGRPRKVFSITDAGRQRLHELLMDTSRHQTDYDAAFWHKVALFTELTPEERRTLSRHYAVYAQQCLDHISQKRRDIETESRLTPDRKHWILSVMDHRIEYWRNELAWAEDLIAQQRQEEVV
ncbi:MAG: helix-turn-helix transcriptional regulator [Chloroflexi bacterium]|nr:helix-turn-helix transcriptional regulator [Chloroflexota bacterium]